MWAAFSSPSNSWLRLAFCTSVSHGPVRIGHRQAKGFSAVDAENDTIASICPLSNQPSTQKYLFFCHHGQYGILGNSQWLPCGLRSLHLQQQISPPFFPHSFS